MSYLPLSDKDRSDMLTRIGVRNFDGLLEALPKSVKNPEIKLPEPLCEMELARELSNLAERNGSTDKLCSFLGAGCYNHFIPAVVNHMITRSEFYTAYTPYQAEASQGTLQSIYEYQTMICGLTGMDVSNASHYDGATSLAEACLLATGKTKRKKVLMAESVHPEYRKVARTYLAGTDGEIVGLAFTESGGIDKEALKAKLDEEVAAFVVQTPNFFGIIEELEGAADLAHEKGALFIVVANPLPLGILKTPGEWGADIACGEGQPLGIPMGFGGPFLGYFVTTKNLMRKIPGRIAGLTKDRNGKPMFVLTLQAREQHIRRESATSNICSNEALCALAACVYMSAVGKKGLKRIAELNVENANYLKERLRGIKGVKVKFEAPVFNEFVISLEKDPENINEKLLSRDIIGGFSLKRDYPGLSDSMLVCVTETKTKDELDNFANALAEILKD